MEFWRSTFSFKIQQLNQLILALSTATSLSANKMTDKHRPVAVADVYLLWRINFPRRAGSLHVSNVAYDFLVFRGTTGGINNHNKHWYQPNGYFKHPFQYFSFTLLLRTQSGGEVSLSSWVPVVKPTTQRWRQAQRCEVIIQTSPETTDQTTNNFHPPPPHRVPNVSRGPPHTHIPSLYPCCTRATKNMMLESETTLEKKSI